MENAIKKQTSEDLEIKLSILPSDWTHPIIKNEANLIRMFHAYCRDIGEFRNVLLPEEYEEFLKSDIGKSFVDFHYKLESTTGDFVRENIKEAYSIMRGYKQDIEKKLKTEVSDDELLKIFYDGGKLSFLERANKEGLRERSDEAAFGIAMKVWFEGLYAPEVLGHFGFKIMELYFPSYDVSHSYGINKEDVFHKITPSGVNIKKIIEWGARDEDLAYFSPGNCVYDNAVKKLHYFFDNDKLALDERAGKMALKIKE